MIGYDTQALIVSSNMFRWDGNGGFQYAKLRILNKAELYAGGVGTSHLIRWLDFWGLKDPNNSMAFTVQPATQFVGSANNPPAYLIDSIWGEGSSLTLWTLNNTLGLWTGATPSLSNVSINCQSYQLGPEAKQLGSSVNIATNDNRLLNAVYQYAGDVRRLWTCHTVKHSWDGDPEARTVIQWYEIDIPTKTVIQQRKYGASGKYYFFPAIQTDVSRNAFIVFARSGPSEYANLRQTGRKATDPLGDLQNSALIAAGQSSYTGGRWGDYFGICRDGANSSVVWMYGEYAGSGNTWRTRVCSAKF
jgi:hypothetical protein